MHGRMFKRSALTAAVAFALVSAGAVFGQTRPEGTSLPPRLLDDERPAQRDSGRDRDGERSGGDRNGGDRMRRDVVIGNPNNDFPSGEVHGAVDSNARAAFARANYRRLEYSLGNAIRQQQYTFEHSHDMLDAQKAEKQAWDDYVAARNAALKSVMNDSKYQANNQLKHELGDQIAETRQAYDASKSCDAGACAGTDKAKMKAVVNLAMAKLDYAQVVTDMEVAALRGDTKVTDARSRLMAAGSKVQAIRDDFDMSMRNSKELAAIRRDMEDARIASITAEAYRNGAVEAANVALDYAYYKNRFTYNLNNAYDYLDYGYGNAYGGRPVRY